MIKKDFNFFLIFTSNYLNDSKTNRIGNNKIDLCRKIFKIVELPNESIKSV